MAIPLLFPVAYFLTMNDKAALAVFYVTAIACVIFDQKEIVKSGYESEPHFVGSALGIIISTLFTFTAGLKLLARS